MYDALLRERARGRCVVQLAKSPAAREPNSVTVVAPYSTPAAATSNATCVAERRRDVPPLYYAGCHRTFNASAEASRVRSHLRALSHAAPSLLLARFTTRTLDVSGDGHERAERRAADGTTLKQRSLSEMQRARYCLIPEAGRVATVVHAVLPAACWLRRRLLGLCEPLRAHALRARCRHVPGDPAHPAPAHPPRAADRRVTLPRARASLMPSAHCACPSTSAGLP